MRLRRLKQNKFLWTLCRNILLAALSVFFGYCAGMMLATALVLVIFSVFKAPGLLLVVFAASCVIPWILAVNPISGVTLFIGTALFLLPTLVYPWATLPVFFTGLLIFLIACSVPAVLRFRIWDRPTVDLGRLYSSFRYSFLLYCGMEFLAFLLGRHFYRADPHAMFFTFQRGELSLWLPVWIGFFCLRLWLLWDTHRTILEYHNPEIRGYAID